MKQILQITDVIDSGSKYKGKDAVGRYHTINTDRVLRKGQSVLLVNQVVVGVVQTTEDVVFEV